MAKPSAAKLDIGFLASELQKARTQHGFDAFRGDEILLILRTAFPFDKRLPEAAKSDILRAAVGKLVGLATIDANRLTQQVRIAETGFLSKRFEEYRLASRLSFRLQTGVRRLERNAGRVIVARAFPRVIAAARADPQSLINDADTPYRSWATILVRVQARSSAEATDLALTDLNVLRAQWNFALNEIVLARHASPAPAVNHILTSGIYTLHTANGDLAFNGHLRDRPLPPGVPASLISNEWKRIHKTARRISRRLVGHPYRADLERALVQYVSALDGLDMQGVFLKLWAVLELLTATPNAAYNVTVRRTQFPFANRPLVRNAVEHLRVRRNEAVHTGRADDESQALVYQIKYYVERLLAFHLNASPKFPSLGDAGEFLDLPPTRADLVHRILLAKRALRFIGAS